MSVFHIVASRPIRKITAAAAALFFLLLALVPGTLRAQVDSREGIILVVASYKSGHAAHVWVYFRFRTGDRPEKGAL